MKNKLLRFLLLNLFVVATLSISAQLVSYDANDWTVSDANFQYGEPANWQPYWQGAGVEFFMTGLNSNYANNVMTSVQSVAFDLTAAVAPQVAIEVYADCNTTPFGGDGAFLQYSIDAGASWVTIGSMATWYDNMISPIAANFAGAGSWSTQAWGAPLTQMVPGVAGQSSVMFKVVFVSDPTGNGVGFAFTNFNVIETASVTDHMEVSAWVAPIGQVCAMTATENIEVTVINLGATTITDFDLNYIVNGAPVVTENVTPAVALAPNASYTYTSTGTFDFTAMANTVSVQVTTVGGADNTLATTVNNENIDVINAFPHNEDWISNYFGFSTGSDAVMTVNGTALELTGNAGFSWNGGSISTTATQAWNENVDNQASAYSCQVDASALPTLELKLDLYRKYSFGSKYSWFRVLVDGSPIADANGKNSFNALSSTGDWTDHIFDLSAYAGTTFTLTFEAANRYAADMVAIDNVLLRQKLANDIAITAITSPVDGCSLGSPVVTVEVSNLGTMPQSGFNVEYSLNAGPAVSEPFPGTLPAGYTMSFTFATPVVVAANSVNSIECATALVGDQDLTNDAMTASFSDVSDDLTTAYMADFNTDVLADYWWIDDANNDNNTWSWIPGSPDGYYAYDFEAASGDDYLYTRCFDLTSGVQYQVCYWYASYLSGSTKNLDVYLVNAQTSVMTTLMAHTAFDTNDAFEFNSEVFAPTADGAYYIAFKASGLATFEAEYIILNDFALKQFVAPTINISAIELTDGANPVVDACEILVPVTVDLDITQSAGSAICPGDMIQFDLIVETSGGSSMTVTEYFTFATSTDLSTVVDFYFNGLDLSTPEMYTFTVEAFYNGVSVSNAPSTSVTHYGYPTGVDFTGLADGYCLNVNDVALSGSWDAQVWAGPYNAAFTSNAGTIHTDDFAGSAMYDADVVASGDVVFTVTNAGGCANMATYPVVVTDPTIDFGTDEVFTTYPVSYTLNPMPAGTYDYMWSTGETTATIMASDFGLYSVTATDMYCSATDEITVSAGQEIDIRMGWGIFSTYIDQEDDISVVMNSVLASIIIAKDQNGGVWWPGTPINTINGGAGTMTIGQGYQYKASAPTTLIIQGTPVVPETTLLSLPQGYSVLGYLKLAASNASVELADFVTDGTLIILKDQDGMVFWPMFSINTLPGGNLMPGQGYKVKMDVADDFYFTANGMGAKTSIITEMPVHFTAQQTGANMTVGIPTSAHSLNIGDEVAVYSASGTLVGSALYNGQNMAVAVYGDDELTEATEGIAMNENFNMKVWNSTEGTETEAQFTIESGKDVYTTDAITTVKSLSFENNASANASLAQNMPNPFASATTIGFSIPEETFVTIAVYNVVGELVEEVVSSTMAAGSHEIVFTAENCAAGSYFYKIITDNFVATKYMTIEK